MIAWFHRLRTLWLPVNRSIHTYYDLKRKLPGNIVGCGWMYMVREARTMATNHGQKEAIRIWTASLI